MCETVNLGGILCYEIWIKTEVLAPMQTLQTAGASENYKLI